MSLWLARLTAGFPDLFINDGYIYEVDIKRAYSQNLVDASLGLPQALRG